MAMKRGHTAIEYKSKIRALRAIRPDISLSSDFIIGFPGETEQDFAATMKLIDEVGFDRALSKFDRALQPRSQHTEDERAPCSRESVNKRRPSVDVGSSW